MFEHRYAGTLLAALLAGEPVVGLSGSLVPTRVAFQGTAAVDDIELTAEGPAGPVTWHVAARRRPVLGRSSQDTVALFAALLTTLRAKRADVDLGRVLLGLAVKGPHGPAEELKELAGIAATQDDAVRFRAAVARRSADLRKRLAYVDAIVEAAQRIVGAPVVETDEVWALLRALRVVAVHVEEGERDAHHAVRLLTPLVGEAARADDLRTALAAYAADCAARGASVSADDVRSAFVGRFDIALPGAPGWRRGPSPDVARQDLARLRREVRLEQFTGREWLFAEVDAALARAAAVVVEAEGGWGKSAFAARMQQTRDYPAVFVRLLAERSVAALRRALAVELRAWAHRRGAQLPDDELANADELRTLTEALSAASATGVPVVVVVDGCDELGEVVDLGEVGLAPLPPGVSLLVTQQPTSSLLGVPDCEVVSVGSYDAASREDVAAFVVAEVERLRAERAAAGEPVGVLADAETRIVATSEGLMLVAALLLDDLRAGRLDATDFPNGLRDYYTRLLARPSGDRATAAAALAVIGVGNGVTERLLAAAVSRLCGRNVGTHALRRLLAPYAGVVIATPLADTEVYGPRHGSFAAYLAGEWRGPLTRRDELTRAELAESAVAAHAAIADVLFDWFLDLESPRLMTAITQAELDVFYATSMLIPHLAMAGRAEDAADLLLRPFVVHDENGTSSYPGWQIAREAAGSATGYRDDCHAVAAALLDAPEHARTDARIALALACRLRAAGVANTARNVPPALIGRLIDLEVVALEYAVEMSNAVPHPTQRAEALVECAARAAAPTERAALLAAALESADQTRTDELFARVAERLLPTMAEDVLAMLRRRLTRGAASGYDLGSHWSTPLLSRLLALLPDDTLALVAAAEPASRVETLTALLHGAPAAPHAAAVAAALCTAVRGLPPRYPIRRGQAYAVLAEFAARDGDSDGAATLAAGFAQAVAGHPAYASWFAAYARPAVAAALRTVDEVVLAEDSSGWLRALRDGTDGEPPTPPYGWHDEFDGSERVAAELARRWDGTETPPSVSDAPDYVRLAFLRVAAGDGADDPPRRALLRELAHSLSRYLRGDALKALAATARDPLEIATLLDDARRTLPPDDRARVVAALAPQLDEEQAIVAWRAAESFGDSREVEALDELALALDTARVEADEPSFLEDLASCASCSDPETHRALLVAKFFGRYLALILLDPDDDEDTAFGEIVAKPLAGAFHALGCPIQRPLATLLPEIAREFAPHEGTLACWLLDVISRAPRWAHGAAVWDAADAVTDLPWSAVAVAAALRHDGGAAAPAKLAAAAATALDDGLWDDEIDGWRKYTVEALLTAGPVSGTAAELAELLTRLGDADDLSTLLVAEHARGGNAFERLRQVDEEWVSLSADAIACVVTDAPSVDTAVAECERVGISWQLPAGLVTAVSLLPVGRLKDVLAVRPEEDELDLYAMVVAAVAARCEADVGAAAAVGAEVDAAVARLVTPGMNADLQARFRLRGRLGAPDDDLVVRAFADAATGVGYRAHPLVLGALQEALAQAGPAVRVAAAQAVLARASGLTRAPLVEGVTALLPALAPRLDPLTVRMLRSSIQ